MTKYVGLTEKRMANKRFRKTEEAILRVFFEEDYYVQMGEMAEKAGVARSTIYSHHRAVREILPDYEKYVLRKYRRVVRRMMKNGNVRLKRIYLSMLFFMIQEKRIFEMLIKNHRRTLLEMMIGEIKMKVISYARLPKNSEKIFRVYISEVVGLVEEWGREGFLEVEIEKLLSEIMYLTDTMRSRLAPLMDN